MLEAVAVIHAALVVTRNGTMFPAPTVLTLKVCAETLCVASACPVKFNAVGETVSTGLVVTASVTGIAVTLPPETLTDNIVV